MLDRKLSNKNNINNLRVSIQKKTFYFCKDFLFAIIILLLRTTIGNRRIRFQL